jgi:hypothetical protein
VHKPLDDEDHDDDDDDDDDDNMSVFGSNWRCVSYSAK